jgi:hypothetical protein
MSDRREEILNSEYNKWVSEKGIGAIYPPNFPEAYKDAAINAMDENGKQMCLDLLEYMAKNMVICGHWSSPDGFLFKHKGTLITKEQLFENFL